MKTIVLGDTHGRSFWKLIVNTQEFDKVIFIGDYFDTHESISPELQMINFKEICEYKEKNLDKVIMLIGNHDEHYFPFMGYSGTSGYQSGAASAIGHLLMTYKDFLQMCYKQDNYLFTHAGVGETWLSKNGYILEEQELPIDEFINDLWKYQPNKFKFTGWEQTGDNIGQTPIWIRPKSLMVDSKNLNKEGYIQIVGHTTMTKIDLENSKKAGYYFIDTLGTSREYLEIVDNIIEVKKI